MAIFELVVGSLVFVLLTFFVRLLIDWRKRSKLYSLLPGPKHRSFVLGNLPIMVGRSKTDGNTFHIMFLQSLLAFSHLFRKEGIFRIWLALDPYIILFSAKTIEPILTSQTILSKGSEYDLSHCWLGTGLLTSTGNKWRFRRKLLTPTFHYNILESFVPVFDQHSKAFVEKLKALVEEDWIDIVPLVPLFTLDVICETAMGIKLEHDKEESREYAKAVAEFSEMLVKRLTQPLLNQMRRFSEMIVKRFTQPLLNHDFLYSLTTEGKKWKRTLCILRGFSSKVVEQRKEEVLLRQRQKGQEADNNENGNIYGRKKRKAFLDLLLEMQLLKNVLSDEDTREEVDTFMFAGHDTISAGISWALYNLGHHPEIQEKVYEEIHQILGDDKDIQITSSDLTEMKYLECVIKESQRITPSVPYIGRHVSEEITINGYTIPRGTNAILFFYSLHHDPNVFPDPEVFNPDRFLPENSIGRSPFAFVPFSAGPRNCIGQKFAMMELKIALCHIIRNFVLKSLDPPDKIHKSALLILRPESKLRLKLTKRDT